ncbi:GNAT family N-acetyltransferase [Aquabacterium sp. OR-4]|uniref:GNAT family N-acetyltransferase n=1 Tax=Aquabacterium sp. OR-4 TaxID=2978127 RepID=UPI0021B26017|nr:GNAT family protein [Aquabacterium sp. OR-4]MDT7836028.1 GNAT family protein [Aquabacterium sp. OR-4]
MPIPLPMQLPTLAGPRVLLRPMTPADAPALFALHADAQVMRYWSTPPWTDPQQALDRLHADTQAHALGLHLRLAIARRERPDTLLGACTLFDLDADQGRAEIGYALAPAAWGRGLMREALALLIGHGFDDFGLRRIEADIDPRNTPSARTLEALGFQREGLLRERWCVAGEVSDSALYGLLRRDWLARSALPGNPAGATAA